MIGQLLCKSTSQLSWNKFRRVHHLLVAQTAQCVRVWGHKTGNSWLQMGNRSAGWRRDPDNFGPYWDDCSSQWDWGGNSGAKARAKKSIRRFCCLSY